MRRQLGLDRRMETKKLEMRLGDRVWSGKGKTQNEVGRRQSGGERTHTQ